MYTTYRGKSLGNYFWLFQYVMIFLKNDFAKKRFQSSLKTALLFTLNVHRELLINKILWFFSEWFLCGILKVFVKKPTISRLLILWDNQRYWNQWNYCKYQMDISIIFRTDMYRFVGDELKFDNEGVSAWPCSPETFLARSQTCFFAMHTLWPSHSAARRVSLLC